jgi:flagellar biogenesis protein FliO
MEGFALAGLLLADAPAFAETTNTLTPPASSLPDVGVSLLRVFGALALVLGIFLGGLWLYRNWQRLVVCKGSAPRLNVLEVRPLGGRHALYVISYDHERFLIASSPAGVNFLSHLQPANESAEAAPPGDPGEPRLSFTQTLAKVLKGK